MAAQDLLSPFEVLEQRKLLDRVQKAHNTASVAMQELSTLPSENASYKKRLNVFFKANTPKLREEVRADERKKRMDTMEERNKFEAMKNMVRDDRSARAQHLEQILQGRTGGGSGAANPQDPLWDGFGTGERVEIVGLSKAAEYNGRAGTVQRFDGERFAVELDAGAEGKKKTLRVKPENLRALSEAPAPAPAPWHSETKQASAAFSGVIRERS